MLYSYPSMLQILSQSTHLQQLTEHLGFVMLDVALKGDDRNVLQDHTAACTITVQPHKRIRQQPRATPAACTNQPAANPNKPVAKIEQQRSSQPKQNPE